ncbi:MAG TPA: low molecular weight protein-tyrosine-phosphatase [Rhabdochlamydiaceae bacterium]|jgi:protein-tyrosine phosphatase
MRNPIALLFVCMGNICRSPALAATFMFLAEKRGVVQHFFVDSAAITGFYVGKAADYRMCKAAKKRDVDIEHLSQLFDKKAFVEFDYILAVNHEVEDLLKGLASSEKERNKILLATAYANKYRGEEIPDPYYLAGDAFEQVMDMAFDACEGLLEHTVQEFKRKFV